MRAKKNAAGLLILTTDYHFGQQYLASNCKSVDRHSNARDAYSIRVFSKKRADESVLGGKNLNLFLKVIMIICQHGMINNKC